MRCDKCGRATAKATVVGPFRFCGRRRCQKAARAARNAMKSNDPSGLPVLMP